MKAKKVKVPFIGLPISSLYDPYQSGILTGILNQARLQKVRILCFAGETFNHPAFFNTSKNALFKLISPDNVDAMILISGSMGLTTEGTLNFIKECGGIPIITLGIDLPDIPSIVIDNKIGIKNIVSHLVEIHGCKRIAFIKGPEDNNEAVFRFQAYQQSLEKYGIPFNQDLVCPGDFDEKSGINAVNLLVEEKKVTFDALMGVDDLSVLSAVQTLKRKGFTVPDDIKVAGFDDIEESLSSSPQLTTVRQPLFELGNLAVKSIIDMLQGKHITQKQILPTRIMIRRSCGCAPYSSIELVTKANESAQIKEKNKNDIKNFIYSEIKNTFFADFSTVEIAPLLDKLEELVDAISESLTEPKRENSIRDILEDMVTSFFHKGYTVSLWEKIITVLFNKLERDKHATETKTLINSLWRKSLVDLYRIESHLQTLQRINFEKETEETQKIGDRLFTCFNPGQINSVLRQSLPTLAIKECYISLYEENKSKAVLIFNLSDKDRKRVHFSMFPSRNLIPKKLPIDSDTSYCILPLFNESDQIGFVLFNLLESNVKIYEALAEKISSALTVATLLEKIEQQNLVLRETENEDLRNTLNSIGDGVITTNSSGKITKMNPEAERLTGWSFLEAGRRQLMDILKINNPDLQAEIENPVDTIFKNGHVVGRAKRIVLAARDGIERQINYSGAPIRDSENNIVGVVLVLRDVTEQYKMEERLLQAQKMDSVGQLAGGIAHDFNNILAGITGAAEVIALIDSENEQIQKYVTLILDTTQEATDLTQKLLAFSQKSKKKSIKVNTHTCIMDAVKILERTIDRRIAVNMELKADHTTIIGDPTQIRKIILNLGINARDAMPEGGELTIATTTIKLDKKYCLDSPFELTPGQFIEISVRDTGTGMDDKTLAHLYEPFFTTKEAVEGTGLGLAAVYGMIKEHQGSILVFSELNQGTVFKVYLPVKEQSTETSMEITKFAKQDGSGCILVIDDERVIRDTLEGFLRKLNYEVILAKDGDEGIEIYKRNKDKIALIILDIIMPKMNGYDAFKAIRTINPDAKILLSSGFNRTAGMDKLQEEGAIGFLQKPYRQKELYELLVKFLKSPT